MFRIGLHKDDWEVLECGRLNTERDLLVFTISQLSDIETILIPLFEKFPLNTAKYLDYLNFKEAFFLFKNLVGENKHILELKQSMNSNRVNFILPANHNIKITGNWSIRRRWVILFKQTRYDSASFTCHYYNK